MAEDEISIPLSRTKLILLIAGCAACVAIGIWMLTWSDESIRNSGGRSLSRNPLFVHSLAVICIALFGLCGAIGVWKLFREGTGLQLSSAGITDASSGIAVGFIPWSDIEGIGFYKMGLSRFLIVKVFDPEKYIAKAGWGRQMIARANTNMCGSPVTISSGMLATSFDDLENLLDQYFAKYGRGSS